MKIIGCNNILSNEAWKSYGAEEISSAALSFYRVSFENLSRIIICRVKHEYHMVQQHFIEWHLRIIGWNIMIICIFIL